MSDFADKLETLRQYLYEPSRVRSIDEVVDRIFLTYFTSANWMNDEWEPLVRRALEVAYAEGKHASA